jgi:hypothetical protein
MACVPCLVLDFFLHVRERDITYMYIHEIMLRVVHCCLCLSPFCLQDNDPLDVLVVMQSQVAPFSLMQVRHSRLNLSSVNECMSYAWCLDI